MVTQTIETTETQVDPATQTTETETTETTEVVVEEGAAPETGEAATPRVDIGAEKPPEYVTKAELEEMRAEVARTAAADALEKDRRARQTEGARKASAEKRDQEARAELKDTLAAAFVSRGYAAPDDDSLASAVQRSVGKARQHISDETLDAVDDAFTYWTDQNADRPDHPAVERVQKHLTAFAAQIRPLIEAEARKGFTADAEVADRVKKAVEADRAARNAREREGQEDIKRVDGSPANAAERGSLAWWSSLGREGRALPENQSAYDAWLARQR